MVACLIFGSLSSASARRAQWLDLSGHGVDHGLHDLRVLVFGQNEHVHQVLEVRGAHCGQHGGSDQLGHLYKPCSDSCGEILPCSYRSLRETRSPRCAPLNCHVGGLIRAPLKPSRGGDYTCPVCEGKLLRDSP